LEKTLAAELSINLPLRQWLKENDDLDETDLRQRIADNVHRHYADKIRLVDPDAMRHYERGLMLQSLDTHWREHLSALDHLRQGIHLRGYAQKNPKQEYKREAFDLFSMMLETVRTEVTRILMAVQIQSAQDAEKAAEEHVEYRNVRYQHADHDEALAAESPSDKDKPFVRTGQKVGRNDPCPCGSGKKYKQCHGRLS
jgi:preprotein translocase subunit SecA